MGGNKRNAKVQNQGEITKKKKEKKKQKKEAAGLELEMTAVSGAGDGDGAAAFHPAPSNPVKIRDGRSENIVEDDAVSVTVVRRKVPVENPNLGGGWIACIDDASGDTYYYQSDGSSKKARREQEKREGSEPGRDH